MTPTELDFDGKGGRKEGGNPETEANPEMNDGEHSQAASVFDRLGMKPSKTCGTGLVTRPLTGMNLKARNAGFLPAKDRRSPCLKLG